MDFGVHLKFAKNYNKCAINSNTNHAVHIRKAKEERLHYLMRMTFHVDGNATSEREQNSLKKRFKQDGAEIRHTRMSVGYLTFIKSY